MKTGSLEAGIFFVPTVGLISTIEPYALIGFAETAPHAAIVEALSGVQDRPEAEKAAWLASPARRLAWHLLRPPATMPNARQFARVPWNFDDRRACAAYLVAAAISRELQGPHDTTLDELWSEADARWRAIARHPDALTWLSAVAARLGIDQTEVVARSVLLAIEEELLPGLYALFSVAIQNESRQHEHCRRGAVLEPSNAPIVQICARQWQYARLDAARQAASSGCLEKAIHKLLGIQVHTGIAKAQLAAEVADLFEVRCAKVNSLSEPSTFASVTVAEEILELLPYDVRVLRVLSALAARIARLRIRNGDFDGASVYLAKAAVLDPMNQAVSKLIKLLWEHVVRLENRNLGQQRRRGKSRTRTPMRLARARARICEIESFAASTQGRHLHERCRQVLYATIAARLGLDPCNSEHMAATVALAGAVEEGSALDDVSTIQALVTAHPVLAGLWWGAIGAARAAADSLVGFALALPQPPRIEILAEEARMIEAMHESMTGATSTWPTAQRVVAQSLYPWLFSRSNAGAKCAALAGVVLFAFGLAVFGSRAWDAAQRDAAYRDLTAAVTADNMAAAREAAHRFVGHTEPEFKDHRIPEVVQSYEKALFHEIRRAAASGDTRNAALLLEESQKLAAWSAHGAPDAEGEVR